MVENDLKECLCLPSHGLDPLCPFATVKPRFKRVLLMSHDTHYNHRSSRRALNQCIMTGNWLRVISPVSPAELQRYDQSCGADAGLGNGGSSLELNCALERRKCSFSIRWKDQRRRIIQLSHLQRLGGQDAVSPIRICGRLGDSGY